MRTLRIMPRLDVKGPNLVKGIHLEGLRVLGKPERFARYYYENNWELLVIVMGSDIRRAILRNMDLNANVKKKSIRIFVF